MKRLAVTLIVLCAGFLPAGCSGTVPATCNRAAAGKDAALEGPAALPQAPPGWKGPQIAVARSHEDIEEIIDGEAHQYYAYDLVSLTHAVYRSPSDQEAVVDLYRMPSAADAFGVYSLWREGAAAVEPIGDEGTRSGGEVRLHKGRLFVHVLVDEAADNAEGVARNLAEQVAQRAPPERTDLPLLDKLPAAERLPNTLIYVKRDFRSQEFLRNVVAAKYQSPGRRPYQLFICGYQSSQEAAEVLGRVAESAPQPKSTGADAARGAAGKWVTYADEFDGEVTVFQAGSYLVGATAGQRQKARALAEKLEQ